MRFHPLELSGLCLIEPQLLVDERGGFARTWCADAFEQEGLSRDLTQCNISFNHRRGTVRGMHFQRAPHAEAKLVRCTRGAIFDVAVDLRPASATFGRWIGRELTADNRHMLYIPEGFAHGFQTLSDDAEVFYQMSRSYHGPSGTGVNWNDPGIDVRWPLPISVISPKDTAWPALQEVLQ